jgi:predicted HAD superfamily phosphohydrolase YqeG
VSLFFLVVSFFVVSVDDFLVVSVDDFLVVSVDDFLVVDFLVVDVLAGDFSGAVVVVVSVLLVHAPMRPAASRTVNE